MRGFHGSVIKSVSGNRQRIHYCFRLLSAFTFFCMMLYFNPCFHYRLYLLSIMFVYSFVYSSVSFFFAHGQTDITYLKRSKWPNMHFWITSFLKPYTFHSICFNNFFKLFWLCSCSYGIHIRYSAVIFKMSGQFWSFRYDCQNKG